MLTGKRNLSLKIWCRAQKKAGSVLFSMQEAGFVVALPRNVAERWLHKPAAKLLSFEGSHHGQARLLLHLVRNVPQAHVEALLFAVKTLSFGALSPSDSVL